MLKSIFKRAGLGFLLGIAVCNFIAICFGDGTMVSSALVEKVGCQRVALLLQTLLSGLCGALCMGGTLLYEAERLPLALSTFIHCIICIVPYFLLSVLLHWTDGIGGAFIMSGIQFAGFFIIWLMMYLLYKKQTKELNRMQKQIHDKQKTEEK